MPGDPPSETFAETFPLHENLMPQRITEDEVRRVAELSRLRLSEEEVRQFTAQLERVLEHVAQFDELDVSGVEPMAHPLDLANALREDVEEPGLTVGQALANAPDADPPFFKVARVLEESGP